MRNVSLPVTRVRMIMKSSPEVASVSQEALHLITVATELFVEHLALIALEDSDDKSSIDYGDLANVVAIRPTLGFLQDIIPIKIKAKEYLEILENATSVDDDDYL
ncbi:hypothetical protein CHUAL_005422 [Chamberlinius hualienensis]